MPTCLAAARGFENIVLLPIGFRAKRFPCSRIERWSIYTPTPIWQVFKIQLAVVGIHWRFQWTDCVKALDQLIATRTRHRIVSETNTSGVGAFQILALMTDLSLSGVRAGAICC